MDSSNPVVVDSEQPHFLAILKNNVYIRVCITTLAILLATRIWSSHKYKQIKFSNLSGQTPPTLPYWIPFFRHAFSMAWDTARFAARSL
jgi:hypothetical protein